MSGNIFYKYFDISKSLNFKSFFFVNKRGVLQSKFQKKNETSYNFPFKVSRTTSGNLPVYTKIRRHGTIVTTVVRHIYGDIKVFKDHLRNICEAPVREHIGYIEVKGLHTIKIKQWLQHIGF
ncbi:hypothetical protein YYC_04358 [Plasmodium yoelii 17X]|uniref:Large ribosomal subunit protein mL49 n=2 Tax=Plasmodium yoelii TaxID=5861 RepID=A0A077Y6E7_PLAYE|nr:mitochondrial large subunit ribosomal protein, putative [Plasmodium yoelii]ETB57467.1 hypothetical protein YYC_04358 [Plasmodium yoelii 17X]CDU17838.1 mitochondrial large subunit ribosomal protein, putative [Plasmodium yoelii]VTZ78255.1 mitochondrial large subunit ribosomal protein, putative [Plasmodium yoelii]|eukprot:XP_022812123.1 mitochondrial large subunit ribosomal protein, putative [Plasmodium yoelii]